MLSLGIRFGRGFDADSVIKLMQSAPVEADFDVVVIGTNPGGVACAIEAGLAGKKTAIIKSNEYSPAEEEGFDEDLNKMAQALSVTRSFPNREKISSVSESAAVPASSFTATKTSSKIIREGSQVTTSRRKVRQSRIDLNNEFFKRGEQCRKLMHNAVLLGDLVENAFNSGWRLTTTRPPLTINWRKMSEEIMDFVMRENWMLATELREQQVEIIEGVAYLMDNHTLKVRLPDLTEKEFTAGVICIAFPSLCILPNDVPGAVNYGITCDDFLRLNESPGKTLIVGALQEGIECAGILASGRLPVTVVTRSTVLKGFDSEISDLIIRELKSKGVKFKEKTNLVSIQTNHDKKLRADFRSVPNEEEEYGEYESTFSEDFDTVLFAVGRRVVMKEFDVSHLGIEVDPQNQKIKADERSATAVPNIYTVGDVQADCPEGIEISQLAGKLLGRRLFHEASELMDYSLIPSVIYTPTEYAFVGLAEEAATHILGKDCVEICYGSFKPLDFIIPPKTGDCFAKVIAFKSNGMIIGLHIFGPHAGEVIQGFATAIRTGLKLTNFRTVVGLAGTVAQEIVKVKDLRTNDLFDETIIE